MGQITSGIGLISGIDTASLIDQLIAVESRPKQLVQQRNAVLTSKQVALQEVNSKLLALKLSADGLTNDNTFGATKANTSDDSVLTATSSENALPGTYDFTVSRLVSSQQTISRGFADSGSTAIAPAGGALTFEFGDARLDTDSDLSFLNGGEGIKRGKIRITDRTGVSAVVDLSRATTVNDVLTAINSADAINVTARAVGDGFVITDNTGSTAADLTIAEVNQGTTAASLGLNVAAVGDTITGNAVNTVGEQTVLAALNDGLGVRILSAGQADLQITTRDGNTYNVDLAGASTIEDVLEAIETATGGAVTGAGNGAALELTDSTAGGSTFAVTALNGSQAAADLGILASDGDADGVITGSRILAGFNTKLLRHLNGGTGVTTPGTIDITNRAGATTNVDLSAAQSVADVIDLINAAGAGVTASLNAAGNGLRLRDTTGDTASDLIVADVTGTIAAELGLAGTYSDDEADGGNLNVKYIGEGTRLDALRGGLGVSRGQFTITDSNGASATVDLSQGNETTIADVLSEINSRGLAINARVNDTGDGILIEDLGIGSVALKIEESGSTTAADLGLLGEAANPGDDLVGSFETTITLAATDTLTQIAQKINDAGIDVSASVINDGSAANPYRLSLASKVSGKGGAFVFDDGGLGFDAVNLNEARNALVFFGSNDPAKAIAIHSAKNTLEGVVPGVTIDLLNTSDKAVRVAVSRDDSSIVEEVQSFVSAFNGVVDSINKHDSYNADTEERGLLLGDPTVSRVQASLYRLMNGRNGDLSSQFNTLSQIGISVGSGAKLEFDEEKFRAALAADEEAVEALFTFKETETDPVTNEQTTTAAGIGVRIAELLADLTDNVLQGRVDSIDGQIALNDRRIEQLDKQLEAKRARLEAQFVAMERALAQLQDQSAALGSLSNLASQSANRG